MAGKSRAGGGGGGAAMSSPLVLTQGTTDALTRDVNSRFGFDTPRAIEMSDNGVLSHSRAVSGASTTMFNSVDRNARVTTSTQRLTSAQSGTGRPVTQVTSRIEGNRGTVTVQTRGLSANQGGPRTLSTRVTGNIGNQRINISSNQGERSTDFGRRVRGQTDRAVIMAGFKEV